MCVPYLKNRKSIGRSGRDDKARRKKGEGGWVCNRLKKEASKLVEYLVVERLELFSDSFETSEQLQVRHPDFKLEAQGI